MDNPTKSSKKNKAKTSLKLKNNPLKPLPYLIQAETGEKVKAPPIFFHGLIHFHSLCGSRGKGK
jgi:hypothetical protein